MTDLINEGRHRALVRASETGLQFGEVGEGADQKEQVAVLFDLIDPNDPDTGRSITWFGFFTDKTVDRTIESLRYLGWEGEELGELPGLAAAGQLAQEVEIVVKHEEYNGEWQAKVAWVNKPGGGAVKLKKPLEGDALATFSARMRGRVRVAGTQSGQRSSRPGGSGQSRGQGGQGSTPHPNAPGSMDDIPFVSSDIDHEPCRIPRCLRWT